MFNSFLASPAIVKALLKSKKALSIASPLQMLILKKFGSLVIQTLGWPISINARMQARILGRFLAGQKGKILDAGGSYGVYSFHFARIGWDVTVLDLNQDNLDIGNSIKECLDLSNISFHYGNLLQTQYSDWEFDAIVICHVIEHIKEDVAVLKEMQRVLKPGGILAIFVAYSEQDIEYDNPHYHESYDIEKDTDGHWRRGYSLERLQSILETTGFEISDATFISRSELISHSPYLFPIAFPLSLFPFQIKNKIRGIAVKAIRK